MPEICKGKALKKHVPLIARSPSVTEPAHMPVAGKTQMAAMLKWQSRGPHAESQESLQFCSAHGDFPVT